MSACDLYGEESTPFKDEYFGKNNIRHLQNMIINDVKTKTGYKISDQDEEALGIIMYNIFSMYSVNPTDPSVYKEELGRLNSMVLNECVSRIITEIRKYLYYCENFSDPHANLIDLPQVPLTKNKLNR